MSFQPARTARRAPARWALGAGTAVVATTLAACSSSGGDIAAPADSASAAGDPHVLNVTISAADGCKPDATEFEAGGLTVKVNNVDATAVTEVHLLDGLKILGEKENIPPGLGGEFAARLDAGKYTLYCPGATPEEATITVTGEAPGLGNGDAATLLDEGTKAYADYVKDQVGYLVQATDKLSTALKGSDLAAAQEAYIAARPFYEKIEPVAEAFTVGEDSIDAAIDARDGDVPAAQWKGFHVIEKGLFETKSLDGLKAVGDQLVVDVKKLQGLVKDATYPATDLANGAQGLLDEVAAGKVTGEEERYSHIDVLDIANNVEGSQQAFAQLQPALEKIDPDLTKEISDGFEALNETVDRYRSDSDVSGYVRYTKLSAADKKALAAAVKVVQEPLSTVASKVANA